MPAHDLTDLIDQLHCPFHRIRQPLQIGLPPRREIHDLRPGQAGPGEQGGERIGRVEEAVAIAGEDGLVLADGAVRLAVERRGRAGQGGAAMRR